MKHVLLPLLLAVAFTGCATKTTIESRKQERYGAYSGLDSDLKAAVDQGQIKVGMPKDAVYIAWGKPSQVLLSDTQAGRIENWLYEGTGWQEYRYWVYRPVPTGYGYAPMPYLQTDYNAYPYVKAEVVFQDGVVREWRTMPRPGY